MMGVVNHVYTEIIRSMEHPWNKWIVSYEEWPRDQVTAMPVLANFLGNSIVTFCVG